MSDPLEKELHTALHDLGPSPDVEGDLLEALAEAPREPVGRHRLPLALGFVTVVALGIAWFAIGADRRAGGTREPARIVMSPDGAIVRVSLDSSGNALVERPDGRVAGPFPLAGEPETAAASLQSVRAEFSSLVSLLPREPSGESTLSLEVAPRGRARWQWIQWLLQTAADPNIRVTRIRFTSEGPGDVPIPHILPADPGAAPGNGGPSAIVVALFAEAGAGAPSSPPDAVTVRLRGLERRWLVGLPGAPPMPGALPLHDAMGELRDALRAARVQTAGAVVGEVEAPPPKGPSVPYEAVFAVLEAFRDAGIADVQFVGAAPPLSGSTPR